MSRGICDMQLWFCWQIEVLLLCHWWLISPLHKALRWKSEDTDKRLTKFVFKKLEFYLFFVAHGEVQGLGSRTRALSCSPSDRVKVLHCQTSTCSGKPNTRAISMQLNLHQRPRTMRSISIAYQHIFSYRRWDILKTKKIPNTWVFWCKI